MQELERAAREDKWKRWDDMHHLTKVSQSAGLSHFSSMLLCNRYDNLFQAPQGDVMMRSLVLLGLLTHAQNECTHQLALPWGTRHLNDLDLGLISAPSRLGNLNDGITVLLCSNNEVCNTVDLQLFTRQPTMMSLTGFFEVVSDVARWHLHSPLS